MPKHTTTPFERYLARVTQELAYIAPEQQEALVAEIRDHLHDEASAAGGDPADSQHQRAVLAQFGPAQRLGRELAAAHGVPVPPPRWLILLSGTGVLLTPLWVVVAFIISGYDESIGESLLLLSQAPVIFVVPIVYLLFRSIAPRLSLLHLVIGLVGGLLAPLLLGLNLVLPNISANLTLSFVVSVGWMACQGLWMLLAAPLAWRRRRQLPATLREHDLLIGPTILGCFVGVAWLAVIGAGIAGGFQADSPIAVRNVTALVTFSWLILNFIWSIYFGYILLSGGRTLQMQPARE